MNTNKEISPDRDMKQTNSLQSKLSTNKFMLLGIIIVLGAVALLIVKFTVFFGIFREVSKWQKTVALQKP